ncbi:hypothetical protein [Pseudotabrizicola sp. 4114]|uniref:hypothetical protein n=1 Tax=Pseudotabrizicola sp. 4114 TaxID=2817731 RepID=UPI00285BAA99|nr:hypothetical protein [Pseudorhodobacter sp. 4114]
MFSSSASADNTASGAFIPPHETLLAACSKKILTPLAAMFCATCMITAAALADECGPVNGAKFICGVDNVEDFVRLPNGQILGSDLAAAGKQGYFFLFSPDHSFEKILPEDIAIAPDPAYAACEGPPDWEIFTPHGMDAVPQGDLVKLYAVNHGGRDDIEVFTIDLSLGAAKFAWNGCLVSPEGSWPDDVAALPSGGLVASSLWDPRDEDRLKKLAEGKPVGQLLEWHADKGWSSIDGTEELSGANGVIVSADGSTIYLAAWSGKQLAIIDRASGDIKTIDLDYTPDNLIWDARGETIFIGGTTANVPDALDCFVSDKINCPEIGVRVDRFDPKTMKIETLIKGNQFGEFGMATGAMDVGNELWVNSYRSDRIAIFDLK